MTADSVRRTVGTMVALLGAIGSAVQAGLLITRGKAICLNEGCRIIEALTRVPPQYINLAGCSFFLLTAILTWLASESKFARRLLGVFLLAGIAAEGVLFGYQNFVAKTFCSWCLVVFALVVLLNILAGSRQALRATAVFVASFVAFSALSFGVIQSEKGDRALDAGTWGVHRCAAPAKQLYLLFSSTCPHCEEVIRALESCNSCNFHFNPIDQVEGLSLSGIDQLPSYDPGVNRNLLALLGIDEVPVLLVPSPEGVSVIRGENRILAFIRAECFSATPLLNVDPSRALDADQSMSIFRDENDGCNVTVDCPSESK
ncbi:MAG: hypothetical protein PHI06_13570 [Desulfobulbaceae bacterium]|nr:hypothetical protein [Desulfobulbaceae bacterium]